jgi:hypothetical protein
MKNLFTELFKSSKQKNLEIKTSNIKEAENYIERVKERKSLPTINSSTFLNPGEHVFLEEESKLMETKSVRQTKGAGGGVRLFKGVSIGQWSSKSESHKEWRTIDTGKITLTNKRIIFDGSKENRVIQISKIIGVNTLLDSIEVSQETRQNSSVFIVKNPIIWTLVLRVLKSVQDPLNLGDTDLNIKFE